MVLVFCTVPEKENGAEYKWQGITQKKRESLGLGPHDTPFTGLPDVRLRGLSTQLTFPIFLHELLDLRVAHANKSRGRPLTARPPKGLLVDIRQDSNFQNATGSLSMLTGSRIFVYDRDRCAVGKEHMQLNGWSVRDTDMDQCNVAMRERIEAEIEGGVPKKKKGKVPENNGRLVDLAGSAQSLGDLSLFGMPLIFVLNHIGLFKADLPLSEFPLSKSDPANRVVELDPDSDQHFLRSLRKKDDLDAGEA